MNRSARTVTTLPQSWHFLRLGFGFFTVIINLLS
jgi:hypothetical protein